MHLLYVSQLIMWLIKRDKQTAYIWSSINNLFAVNKLNAEAIQNVKENSNSTAILIICYSLINKNRYCLQISNIHIISNRKKDELACSAMSLLTDHSINSHLHSLFYFPSVWSIYKGLSVTKWYLIAYYALS